MVRSKDYGLLSNASGGVIPGEEADMIQYLKALKDSKALKALNTTLNELL